MKDINFEKEFHSIKEFAEFVGITEKTLRRYDDEDIFAPAKRDGDGERNKYRFYSPIQITTIKMIRVLTEIGVSFDTIRELKHNRTPEKLLKLLRQHKNQIADNINVLQEVYSIISTYNELLYDAISVTETEITVTEMPKRNIILGELTDFNETAGFYREFVRFCRTNHEPNLNMSYPVGGYWDNITSFFNEPAQPARFFSLDPNGNDYMPAGLYLVGYTRGYYGQTNDLPKRMAAYAKNNGLKFEGPVYNIYLTDALSEIDRDQYLLQVSASVVETRHSKSRHPQYYFKK